MTMMTLQSSTYPLEMAKYNGTQTKVKRRKPFIFYRENKKKLSK